MGSTGGGAAGGRCGGPADGTGAADGRVDGPAGAPAGCRRAAHRTHGAGGGERPPPAPRGGGRKSGQGRSRLLLVQAPIGWVVIPMRQGGSDTHTHTHFYPTMLFLSHSLHAIGSPPPWFQQILTSLTDDGFPSASALQGAARAQAFLCHRAHGAVRFRQTFITFRSTDYVVNAGRTMLYSNVSHLFHFVFKTVLNILCICIMT